MAFTSIEPLELTPKHIGATLRLTWRADNEKDDGQIQGRLVEIRHSGNGRGRTRTLITLHVGNRPWEQELSNVSVEVLN